MCAKGCCELRQLSLQCVAWRRLFFGYCAGRLRFLGYANFAGNGARAGINYGSQIKCFAGYANFTSNGAPRIK